MAVAVAFPNFATILSAGNRKQMPKTSTTTRSTTKTNKKGKFLEKSLSVTGNNNKKQGFSGETKNPVWQCVKGCGACCKLDKGPAYPSPQEIFEDPSDIQLFESLIGPDGWCINFDKTTRTCSIYSERPYFCRVEPDIFQTLYGIPKKKFNKEACSCCVDAIKYVYGAQSQELHSFNHAIRTSNNN